ncbi:MAG TPA: radical SAM protein [Polyangiaceae bacterium]|nr:radical SAM protein [Polyangiaceae bacterium]
MDLHSHLMALVAPKGDESEVFPGARLKGASTELGPRLTFEVGGVEVHVEVAKADDARAPRKHAARSRRLLFSYRTDGGGALDPKIGQALCRAVAARAEQREDEALAALARDAEAARSAAEGTARIREVRVDRLLEQAGAAGRRYYTLSPYVGCLIGCRFCYAQQRIADVRRLWALPDAPWGSYVDVRVNAAEILARELADLSPAPVKFCPIVSDPYHAVEARFQVTRACLLRLRDARPAWPTLVLTRARLIERDADVLASMAIAYAGASIPTIDDEARRHFEPRGASIADRLAALHRLRAAGVRTFAVVQPVLPGSIEAFADALAAAVSSARVDVLNGTYGADAEFSDERYSFARSEGWQRDRAIELREALAARGVALWEGELPPEIWK